MELIKKVYRFFRSTLRKIIKYIKLFFANKKIDLSAEEAQKILDLKAPRKTTTALTENNILEPKYDLTLIIPAYNVEKYIKECLESVLNQKTNYSFIVKVIDDGSTDSTGKIIDSFLPNEKLKVIHQSNKGFSGARNVALKNIESEYIMFVDSDDYILPGSIEALMKKAKERNCDIVEGTGYKFNQNGKLGSVKSNINDFMGVPWGKVFKSNLFERFHFPEGWLYEDSIIGGIVLPLANNKTVMPYEVYAYRIHSGSITQKHDASLNRVDSYWISLMIMEIREQLGIKADYDRYKADIRRAVFTYRRTVLLPEDIKQSIFVLTNEYFIKYYKEYYLKDNSIFIKSLKNKQYKKYCILCEN